MGDPQEWYERLKAAKYLTEREMKSLCRMAVEIMVEESNVRHVSTPAIICGDIHGQFADLLELFRIGGQINETSANYVFLGDLVDRGFNSVETLSLLLVLKVLYPHRLTLIRGNHESRQVTSIYGFYDECAKKYGGMDVWRACCEVFDCIPLAALVGGQCLCVHGGLSPELRRIDQFRLLNRRMEIPTEGAFADLVWSDPDAVSDWVLSPRGAGYLYGAKVTREFLHVNDLTLVARAHQLVQEGYKYHFDEDHLVTVWSAPNYCYRCGNLASILRINEDQSREYTVFSEVDTQVVEEPTRRPAYFL